jgi:hypothetical protein
VIFQRIAARYIAPAKTVPRAGAVFDVESNGLLNTATKIHCITIVPLDSDRPHEYGPNKISAGLEHLDRLEYSAGHNIVNFDLPLLRKLHGWAPKANCRIVDTLIAGRTILPNIRDIDDEVAARGGLKLGRLRGKYTIEAWGQRLGMPKVGADIEDFSTFTPEMMARCVADTLICKKIWQLLQPDGYSPYALELETRVAPICEEIAATGMYFDVAAAEKLRAQWTARRSELEAQLLQQFPGTNLNSRRQIGE